MKVVLKSLEYRSKEQSSRINLPDPVVLRILRALPRRDEAHLAQTCRQLNSLVWVARTSQLCSALEEFHQERTRLIDKTRDGDTLLSHSLKKRDQRMACLAAALGASLRHTTFPVHLAVQCKHLDFLNFILQLKSVPKLNTLKNVDGKTPFQRALDASYLDCLIPLVRGGAYVNARTPRCENALFKAIAQRRWDVMESLVNNGANLEVKSDRLRRTPLYLAISNGTLLNVKCLVRGGARVDIRDSNFWTPLHEAAILGKFRIARLLLDHGARLGAKDGCGLTPLHCAPNLLENL